MGKTISGSSSSCFLPPLLLHCPQVPPILKPDGLLISPKDPWSSPGPLSYPLPTSKKIMHVGMNAPEKHTLHNISRPNDCGSTFFDEILKCFFEIAQEGEDRARSAGDEVAIISQTPDSRWGILRMIKGKKWGLIFCGGIFCQTRKGNLTQPNKVSDNFPKNEYFGD